MKRNGVTLADLILTVLLIGMLFAACQPLVDAERRALRLARHNTIALFALEGLRNRILAEMAVNPAYDADRGAAWVREMKLPYPLVLALTEGSAEPGAGRRLELRMSVPPRGREPGRVYLREVPLP